MPKVTAQGKIFDCAQGDNLRQVLLKNGIDLYNGGATVINCHGLGSCGTLVPFRSKEKFQLRIGAIKHGDRCLPIMLAEVFA
jgi:hypothetical protein